MFDTDFHLNESPPNYTSYLDEPFDKVVERGQVEYNADIYPEGIGIFSFSSISKTILQNELQRQRDVKTAMEDLDLDYVLVQPTLNL